MRIIFIVIFGMLISISSHAINDKVPESYESLRARIKIKFALDPILSKQNITLQHQNGTLTLIGQVNNPIVEEQALYLIKQSTPKADKIKNELIVENIALSPKQQQTLIELAAKARLEAAGKYQMKNIPFIGMNLTYKSGVLFVKGTMSNEQQLEIRNVLKNFKQIKRITFSNTNSESILKQTN